MDGTILNSLCLLTHIYESIQPSLSNGTSADWGDRGDFCDFAGGEDGCDFAGLPAEAEPGRHCDSIL